VIGDPVQRRFLTPAGDICWFEWGQLGSNPSLLLLHATGFHARLWDPVISHLQGFDHIIAPDLRGHGRSYRPDSLADWPATAADIMALVDSLPDIPFVVAGHSMGGVVAAHLARHRPERVTRLILIDPVLMSPETYQSGGGWGFTSAADHPIARRRNAWSGPDQMLAHFAERPPYSGWQPAALKAYCDHGLRRLPDESFELACLPVLEASCYMGSTADDPYGWLGQIACPTTIVRAQIRERTSALDFTISPTWPELASAIPGAIDMHWQDLTHFIPMEAPERVADILAKQG
jgi:lipase